MIAPPSKPAITLWPSKPLNSNCAEIQSVCIGASLTNLVSLCRKSSFSDSQPRCTPYFERFGLGQRGDLTIWVKDEALSLWTARRPTSRGGQPKYSDLAITLCLTLRVVYGLALRQTQGLMRSVAALMGFDIAVPDFSTLSRRSKGLALPGPVANFCA
ncbi:transposase [Rhizobium ruizarguesonis]